MNYEDNKQYINKCVRMFIRRTSLHLYRQFDDLYQEAVIAFITCQDNYNTRLPWKPWLKRSIYNHLSKAIRSDAKYHKIKQQVREHPQGYEDVIDMDLSYEQSDSVNVSRFRDSEEEDVYDDTLESLMVACDDVSEEEMKLMDTYLSNEGNCDKTGAALGVDRSTVWRRIQKIVTKLQAHVGQ